jgi:hypothetical protein
LQTGIILVLPFLLVSFPFYFLHYFSLWEFKQY